MFNKYFIKKIIRSLLCLWCCVLCFTTVYAEEMSPGEEYSEYFYNFSDFEKGDFFYLNTYDSWITYVDPNGVSNLSLKKFFDVIPNTESYTLYFSFPNDVSNLIPTLLKNSSYSRFNVFAYDSNKSRIGDGNGNMLIYCNADNGKVSYDYDSEHYVLSVTLNNINNFSEDIHYISITLSYSTTPRFYTFWQQALVNGAWVSDFDLYKSTEPEEPDPPPTEPDNPDNPDKPSIDESNLVSSFYTLFIDRLSFISKSALESPVFLGFIGIFLIFIILEIFLFLFNKGGYK